MFFRKKSSDNKEKRADAKQLNVESNIAEDIHVMPQRFYIPEKKTRLGTIIIIIVGLLVIAGLSVAAYFFNENTKNGAQSPVNINNNDSGKPVNQNTNANTNSNSAIQINSNLNYNIDQANINSNRNSAINENTNQSVASSWSLAPDTDSDNLTAAEEILFLTDSANSDSDGDGYSDGQELISGYDPSKASVTLAGSGLVNEYRHSNYSIIYPKSWQVKESGQNSAETIFQATTGEFINILIVSNPKKLSLTDWYKQNFDDNVNSLTQLKIGNLSGLRSTDKLSYYLVDSADLINVYSITYNIGNLNQINFLTTFNVMVKNFVLDH